MDDNEYLQHELDKQESLKQKSKHDDIRNRVLARLNDYEKTATEALTECDLMPDDVRDVCAVVGLYGYGATGCLPERLTSVLSGDDPVLSRGKDDRNLSDARERGWIAANILAFCRLAKYGCNPALSTDTSILEKLTHRAIDGWDLFIIAEALAESAEALRDPAKMETYLSKQKTIDSSIAAKKSHAEQLIVKEAIIKRYREGTYKNARQASITLTCEAIDLSKKTKRPLSESNAQRTVYEWLLKDK